jgi:drug/metabolite transporter (DMT)-like permease
VTAKAIAVLLGVALIWGASFLLIKIAVEEASPIQVVAFRTIGGAFVLLAVLRIQRHRLQLTPAFIAAIGVLAVVSTVLPFLLITWAETRIDSGPTALLNSTTPLFTLAFAATLLRDERISGRGVLGVLIGMVGVGILMGHQLSGLDSSSLVAELAVVGGSAGYGLGAVMVRMLVRNRPAIVLSALQISFASIIMAGLTLGTGGTRLDLSLEVWLAIAGMAFFGTGIAYIGYYWLIENVGSVRASLVTYVIPVVAVALGAAVLDEAVGWNTFAGGALIVLGVAFGTGSIQARRARADVGLQTADSSRPAG